MSILEKIQLEATATVNRIWLVALATGPVFLHLILFLQDFTAMLLYRTPHPWLRTQLGSELLRLCAVYVAMLFYGALLSLPFYLALKFLALWIFRLRNPTLQLVLLVAASSLLTVLPFAAIAYVDRMRLDLSTFALPLAYLAGVWTGLIWVLKKPGAGLCG
jgi:hypothetical protein